jgi:DNA-binding transcriptional LysR family regulator
MAYHSERALAELAAFATVVDHGGLSAVAARARAALVAANEADAAAIAMRAKPSGTLRMTMSPALAHILLAGPVASYAQEHPDVVMEIDATTRTVDLLRERWDIAVRVGRLPDSSLVARRLGHAGAGYYASRAYLARRGKPETPEDLAAHDAIAMPRGDRAVSGTSSPAGASGPWSCDRVSS